MGLWSCSNKSGRTQSQEPTLQTRTQNKRERTSQTHKSLK